MDLRISDADALILLIFACVTLAIGLTIARGSGAFNRFMVADRDMPWWAVLGSIIATETSAIGFLGIPSLVFADGGNFGFLQLVLGLLLGRIVVAVWFLPAYFDGDRYSAYEVLRDRFGVLTERATSTIFIAIRTVIDGLKLYLTSLVLARVLGIELLTCVLAIGVGTMIYAAIGGIRSVIWNDCFHLVVYLAGAIAVLIVIASRFPEGFRGIVDFGQATGRFVMVESLIPSFQTANFWSGLVGGIFISIATHGTDQMMVQHYLCARSLGQARLAVVLSGPFIAVQFALLLFVGVALAANFGGSGRVISETRDEILAVFVVYQMPVFWCGLTLAAVVGVAMSTLSSSLTSSASAFVNAFIKPGLEVEGVEPSMVRRNRRLTFSAQAWTIAFGCAQMSIAAAVTLWPTVVAPSWVQQMITWTAVNLGLIAGVFMLGFTTRRFSQISILMGVLVAFGVTVVLIFPPSDWGWKLHGWWSAAVAAVICFSTANLCELFIPRRAKANPPGLAEPSTEPTRIPDRDVDSPSG